MRLKNEIPNLSLHYKVRSSALFALGKLFGAHLIAPRVIDQLFSRGPRYRSLQVYRTRKSEARPYEIGSVRHYYLKAS